MKPDRKKKQHSSRESRQPERKTKRGGGGDQSRTPDVEPSAGSEITPVWLFVLMGVMLYGGMLYLDSYAGGFNPKVYEAFTSYEHVENANPKSGPEMLIAKGESLYMVCAACHQMNGMGVAAQFPPLAGSEWVNEPNPARLIRIPLHGMNGPIKVKDQDWNASMAALGAALSSEDIAAILSYIRQAWGNNAPPVSPADVDAVKEDTKSRPMDGSRPWLIDDLMKVPVAP